MRAESPPSAVRRTPDIKICGLTRAEDVALAESLGATFVGGIRAGGPRLLSAEQWRNVLGPARPGVGRVAVVGEMSAADVIAESRSLDADIVQWHGDPDADDAAVVAASGLRLWPVLRVEGVELPEAAWQLGRHGEALVLDAKVTGQLGGTGIALDWASLAQDVARWRADFPHVRLVLAGGLTEHNVARAIALLSPDVVDVSSGVELAPGIKSPERMRAFVDAVRGQG